MQTKPSIVFVHGLRADGSCFSKVILTLQAVDLFDQKVGGPPAWRSKPSSYILATNDGAVHPELQRFLAKRMGATTHEVASSHVPMLSNPGLVIDAIRTAANSVQRSAAGHSASGRVAPSGKR